MNDTAFATVASPIGRLEIESDGRAITQLTIEGAPLSPFGTLPHGGLPGQPDRVVSQAMAELQEYFAGERTTFSVALAPSGTPFQRAIRTALQGIPHGTSVSYGQLARLAGSPGASRAAGGAVGANPVPILVPCHRVLGQDARLTGYSGGSGLATKVALLELEGIIFRA